MNDIFVFLALINDQRCNQSFFHKMTTEWSSALDLFT
jgi:hypothetical protein